MSKSLNRVQLIGNLGADPEVRTTQSGTKVANLRLATNERWTDRQGNPQEHTEWHRVVLYGPLAEIAERYMRRGTRIYVEGSIRTDKWQDRDGNTRYTTEIRARDVILLDGRDERGPRPSPQAVGPEFGGAPPAPEPDLADDDIPF